MVVSPSALELFFLLYTTGLVRIASQARPFVIESEFNRVQNSSRGQQLARLFRYVHVERSTKYLFASRDIRGPHTCRISDLKGKGEERFFATCRRRPEVASNSLLPRSRAYKTATRTCPARSFTRYWVYYRCFGPHRGRQITGYHRTEGRTELNLIFLDIRKCDD